MAAMTIFCPQCRLRQPESHRYCVACGATLPSHLLAARTKSSRWFPGVRVSDDDPAGGFLRVSCYREDQELTAPEGSVTIPGHHVRFSIWVDDAARSALSIPETEAIELARFVMAELERLNGDEALTR